MNRNVTRNRRILIVDDNEEIHHDFRRILESGPHNAATAELDELEASILGSAPAPIKAPSFELTSAFQGAEALAKVQQSLQTHSPYALAFIDVRMPPGWDGIETLSRIWREDTRLQAVICSAYSDYSWENISERFGTTDRLLILKKPFDTAEVRQMACALLEKWNFLSESQRTGQELRESEARFRGMVRALPDALLLVAADGTCLDYKPSRDVPSSLQPAFPPGSRLGDTLPADIARRMLEHLTQALDDGRTHVLEYGQPVGGQPRSFEARISSTENGEALVVLRDTTGRTPPASAARPSPAGTSAP